MLQDFGVLADAGGNLQIESLFQAGTATLSHVEHFKKRLTDAAIRRQQDQTRREIKGLLEANASPAEILSKAKTLCTTVTADIDFGWIDSTEFASRVFDSQWLVDFVLKADQPCIMAGPSKTLKTTVLAELFVSLATGLPFFERHQTQKVNVAFISAESGEETLQETARRVCQTKGIDFGSLGKSMFWCFRAPQITEPDHIASLASFVTQNDIQVLGIDPAYLTMNLGDDAKNQFVVGSVLQNLTQLQSDTGVMPILAAHTNKNIQAGVELELQHIA